MAGKWFLIKEAQTILQREMGIGLRTFTKMREDKEIEIKGKKVTKAALEKVIGHPIDDNGYAIEANKISAEEAPKSETKKEAEGFQARADNAEKEIEALTKEKQLKELRNEVDSPILLEKLISCVVDDITDTNIRQLQQDDKQSYLDDREHILDVRELNIADSEVQAIKDKEQIDEMVKSVTEQSEKVVAENKRVREKATEEANRIKQEAETYKQNTENECAKQIVEKDNKLVLINKAISEKEAIIKTEFEPILDALKDWDNYMKQAVYDNNIEAIAWGTNRALQIHNDISKLNAIYK